MTAVVSRVVPDLLLRNDVSFPCRVKLLALCANIAHFYLVVGV